MSLNSLLGLHFSERTLHSVVDTLRLDEVTLSQLAQRLNIPASTTFVLAQQVCQEFMHAPLAEAAPMFYQSAQEFREAQQQSIIARAKRRKILQGLRMLNYDLEMLEGERRAAA